MATFFATFAAIEYLLPRLYRREFVSEYDQLMVELESELINELQIGLTFQTDELAEVSMSLERAMDELAFFIHFYDQNCLEWGLWGERHEDLESLISNFEMLDPCEVAILEINFLSRLVESISAETENWTLREHEPMVWFHFKQMRDHHEQYGSIPYLVIERILNNFATTNNVRIWVWDIPAGTRELGETLFYIEGRSAEMEFMTRIDETEIGVREQRFYDPLTGGFAIAVSGTFQPAYRVLTIISTLQQQLLIVIFFVSLIVSSLFSYYLARPIVALSTKSKKLRKLQFDEHLQIKRRDEIGDLSDNLNFMSCELKNALDELQAANEKLKKEMEREREQERQRRNLFTSISHELKTPITILKGEIGGMIDQVGTYKDRDTYLESAYGWTETLEKLVSEILTISRLEGEKMRLDLSTINISALLTKLCQTHQVLADNQKITFNQQLDPYLMIKADEAQLQIAISNVINNAIFYTQFGYEVDVVLKQEEAFAVLVVTNSGVHIAQDELKNLFNPFYRLDKSRNRHTGGSGLGLFIVKNILELHGFFYGIENIERGIRFTIKMPLE